MKNVIPGQMSIFDFISENPNEEKQSQLREFDIMRREILKGSGFENGKTRIYNYFKQDHTEKELAEFLKNEYGVGGWSIEEGWCDHDAGGINLKFNEPIGKCTALHSGWPMVAKMIKELIEENKYVPQVCKYSEHSCNRKELWKIAESFDDVICPHVCCRKCAEKLCGARCNGSEEPKEKPIDDEWHDIEEEPQEGAFCKFEYLWSHYSVEDSKGHCKGWWKNGKVIWLNMPYDIGKKRVIRWKAEKEEQQDDTETDDNPKEDDKTEKPKCRIAEECEAYPRGCGGTIDPCRFGGPFKWSNKTEKLEDVHIDREGRPEKAPSWMNYKRCENCKRWQRYDIKEQPPAGWGVMGYCMEHKEKCSTGSYCDDFEDKNEVKNG